jgi:DNA-binding NarL/FixJ family response regulator
MPIRVLLAEDHAVVRAGLERLLAGVDDIEVVGAAHDGLQALELVESLRPDVVLMDLVMPRLDGRAATRRILAASPQVHVVVLTSFSDRRQIFEALDAGAVGYLLKDAEPEELVSGIRAAARGESPLHPKAAQELIRARAADGQTADLSPREREVLILIARGYANKRIARELGISEGTVKAHVTAIFQALRVADRTQAALWAQRHGVV